MTTTPSTPTESALIDAAQFARLLSVSKPTIWRLKEAGKLPQEIALTSQVIRWRREVVMKWIDAGCPFNERNINEQGTAGRILPQTS